MSLNELPNEILLHIFSFIDPYPEDRILGLIPDDPPPSPPDSCLIADYVANSQTYCKLALVNKRFNGLVQELLFYAPVLSTSIDDVNPRLMCFLRTLLARPDLRRHVRQVRFCCEIYPLLEDWSEYKTRAELATSFVPVAHDAISALDLDSECKEKWYTQMSRSLEIGFIGALFALLPRIEVLSISDERSYEEGVSYPDSSRFFNFNVQQLKHLPMAYALRYLKVSSLWPHAIHGLTDLPHIRTFDLSGKLTNSYRRHLAKRYHPNTNVNSILNLRIDYQVKTVGILDSPAGLSEYALDTFPQIRSLDFYSEPSNEKNPFRSVRAFPYYQANIQHYPDPSVLEDPDAIIDVWDEQLYIARTEYTDYQRLVDTLIPIRPRLESLRLPGGFWTLPGGMRKLLPRFERFPQLRRLAVPQAAILSLKLDNMRPLDGSGDFELSPIVVLPPRLQHLRIFDADAGLLRSPWLEELFSEHTQFGRWPELQRLEILFGPACGNEELQVILDKKGHDGFWDMVGTSVLEVSVGRDDEVPAVTPW